MPADSLEARRCDADDDVHGGDTASLVLFQAVGGTRLAWQTMVNADQDSFVHVIDAQTGSVLYRRSLVNYANPGHASVWEYYPRPGPSAGTQRDVDLSGGWLPTGATTLTSNNAHVYTDVNANNTADASEEVAPAADGSYSFPFTVFTLAAEPGEQQLLRAIRCSWRSQFPQGSFSWQTNRSQNAAQVFYYVNKFHDHLPPAPIGFTEAAGQLPGGQLTGQGLGSDAIHTEPLDGANTLCCVGGQPVGLPNNTHIDNANIVDAARRHQPADADVPVPRARHESRRGPVRRRRTAATRRTSSTTSTRTASRTAWWSTPTATRPSAASRPERWARRGATGTRWTSSSPRATSDTAADGELRVGDVRRPRATT